MSKKYSIIVPVFNGMPYLESTISTILSSKYEDFELIISDDNSSDNSRTYLESISDSRLKLFRTPHEMSLSEHWEWALSQASGEWMMFVGQDDGVQDYFFQHAEKLTSEAKSKGLRLITSRRAYLFWPGCEDQYPGRIHFYAWRRSKVRNLKLDALASLFLGRSYHELPQMYGNSIFHASLLEEARKLQGGKVFVSHPQDSNLAALATLLERKYLRSEIPLGWVGTSPSSAGLAIATVGATDNESINEELARAYTKKIEKSEIRYLELAGDFSFGESSIYFWQSLVCVSKSQGSPVEPLLNAKIARILLFSGSWSRVLNVQERRRKITEFARIIELNGLRLRPILVTASVIRVAVRVNLFLKELIANRIKSIGPVNTRGIVGFYVSAKDEAKIDLTLINSKVEKLVSGLLS